MKKFLFIAVTALMMAVSSNAEIKFGLRGGLNLTNMSMNSSVLNSENQTGFYIGPTIKIGLPVIDFDASVLYDQRSSELKVDDVASKDITKKDLVLQANIRKGFGLGDAASVFFFAGPQVAFNIGSKDVNQTATAGKMNWSWKDSNFSVNVGLGAMFMKHVEVKASYNIACGKTGDASILDTTGKLIGNATSKNNAWQLGLAYYF